MILEVALTHDSNSQSYALKPQKSIAHDYINSYLFVMDGFHRFQRAQYPFIVIFQQNIIVT